MTDQAKTWKNLRLRLEASVYRECRGHGLAILSVRLLLRDGVLVGWTRPVVTYTEPRGHGGIELEDELLNDAAVTAIVGNG